MTTAKDFQDRIIQRAAEDDDFRARLTSDPTATVGAELNVELPEGLTINVHEDGSDTVNLVLPPKTQLGEGDLQSISGGSWHDPDEPAWE